MANGLMEFIHRNSDKVSPWVRNVVYLLFALAVVELSLIDPVVVGKLTIKKENGKILDLGDYLVEGPLDRFKTNSEGWFVIKVKSLTTDSKLRIGKNGGYKGNPTESDFLGTISIGPRIPVISNFQSGRELLVLQFNEKSREFDFANSQFLFPEIIKSAKASSKSNAPVQRNTVEVEVPFEDDAIWFRILGLSIKDNLELFSAGVANAYMKIFIDGKLIEPAGFPNKDYKSSLLRIAKDANLGFEDLSFQLPWHDSRKRAKEVNIEIWKSGWFPIEDKLASFKIPLVEGKLDRITKVKSASIEGHPADNAILEVELGTAKSFRDKPAIGARFDVPEAGLPVSVDKILSISSPKGGVAFSENQCKLDIEFKNLNGQELKKHIRISRGVFQNIEFENTRYRFIVNEIIATTNPDICRIYVERRSR